MNCRLCGQPIQPLELTVDPTAHNRGRCPAPAPGPNGLTYSPYSQRIHDDPSECAATTCGGCFLASP
jgi:hypothetical protein